MNEVKEIFSKLTDEQLEAGVGEIRDAEDTGFIKEGGVIRDCARELSKVTNQPLTLCLFHAQTNILKESAYRWVDSRK